MQTIKLPRNEVETMREFYLEELQKTLRHLQHIKSVLNELGEGNSIPDLDMAPKATRTKKTADSDTAVKAKPRKKRASKPGRKSKWEPLIMKRLRQLDKPVTYEELTDEIMTLAKIPPLKKKSTKQAIMSVAFRMRSRDKKIDTFSVGAKEKYIGLKPWFEKPGIIKLEYAKKIEKTK